MNIFGVVLKASTGLLTLAAEKRMKNRLIAVFLLAGFWTASGCSPSTEEKRKEQVSNVSATVAGNSNAAVVVNGSETAPPRPVDANADSATTSDALQPPGDTIQKKVDGIRKSGEQGPAMDAATLASKNARPAPDNSTFTSYLTDAGYEIRSFKNHPQLLKVEKKVTSDGNQSIKVFLRNGKVVDLPGKRINPLASAPASLILEAAGVQPTPPPRAPAGTAPVKKPTE